MLAGQMMTGAVVSATLMVCEAVEVWPQRSVAVQVRTCTTGQVPLLLSAKVNVAVPHVSEAVGEAKTGTAGHSIVLGPGTALIVGGVVSATLMVCEAVEVWPQRSVAVQVRTCTTGQVPLLLSAKVNVAVPHVSEAVGEAKTGTAGHSIVLGPGTALIVGGVVSATLMVCEAVEVWPQRSVAVQVRTCTTGQVPLLLSAKVNVAVPHVSEAVGEAKTGTAGHSIVLGPGTALIVGGVVSATLMVCEAVEVWPQRSVAVQVRTCTTGQVPLLLSAKVNVAVPHVSEAVGEAKTGTAGHSIVLGPGTALIVGGVVSATLMVCEAVEVWPQRSVAVQVRTCTTG